MSGVAKGSRRLFIEEYPHVTLPQGQGAEIYNDKRSAIDTVGRHKTLTQRLGDTGEGQVALRSEDMSKCVATPIYIALKPVFQISFSERF